MCRLAAYAGAPVALDTVVTRPMHSLLIQSQSANEAKLAVNGDGFGIAWYGHLSEPGLYRDVLPAWSDVNLKSVCTLVQSSLFLAHVRASTTGEITRANCHPFKYRQWSFMHNGQIARFDKVRRQLEAQLPDALYAMRQGATDSELIFLLLLANGLERNCQTAVTRTIEMIESAAPGGKRPNRLTCVLSDGQTLFGFRHASDRQSPTLYFSQRFLADGLVVASEPLDGGEETWHAIPDGMFFSYRLHGGGQPEFLPLGV
jgi:glutamine amidotransferase